MASIKELQSELRTLLTLAAIRLLSPSGVTPTDERWTALTQELSTLVTDGCLAKQEDGTYTVTKKGKKEILEFRAETVNILDSLSVFKEVDVRGRIVDGRLPVCSFYVRDSKDQEYVYTCLVGVGMHILWESWESIIKDTVNWQQFIVEDKFFNQLMMYINDHSWLTLGNSRKDAERTARLLIHPAYREKSLVQIKRAQ